MAAICHRQETRLRKPKSQVKQEKPDTPLGDSEDDMIDSSEDTVKTLFPLVCIFVSVMSASPISSEHSITADGVR